MNAKQFFKKYPLAPCNHNYLYDLGCPNCGNRKSFAIDTTRYTVYSDSGVLDEGDSDYDVNSPIMCRECGLEGLVDGFTFDDLDELYENRDRLCKPNS